MQVWTEFRVASYRGSWLDDKPHGLGIMVSDKNDKYAGELAEGMPNGLGAMVTKEKESFGDFREWKEHGLCTLIDSSTDY